MPIRQKRNGTGFHVYISKRGRRRWLGWYATHAEAKAALDKAAKEIKKNDDKQENHEEDNSTGTSASTSTAQMFTV